MIPDAISINERIATHLMGWQVVGRTTIVYSDGDISIHPHTLPGDWMCFATEGSVYLRACQCATMRGHDLLKDEPIFGGHFAICLDAVPNFCGTWKGMQLVVEAMSAQGWDGTIAMGRGEFVASFWPSRGAISEEKRAGASSAPLAVALAALQALGVEV